MTTEATLIEYVLLMLDRSSLSFYMGGGRHADMTTVGDIVPHLWPGGPMKTFDVWLLVLN